MAGLVLAGAAAAGCAPVNREELVQEVLREDPAFREVLDRHRELANRIETYKRELALKRKTVEDTTAQLRRDLASAAASVKGKVAEAKKRIQPERERIELTLSLAGEELRAKQAQRASVGRSIAQLKKALDDKRSALSAEERGRKDAQLNELVADAGRLDQEIGGIRAHVRLLKLKLLLIKL
jgi:uncharacterized protein YdcH (DUF465 family)